MNQAHQTSTKFVIKAAALACGASLWFGPGRHCAQAQEIQTPAELAQKLGFEPAEIEKIKAGEIVRKDLQEREDELAGVVAGFFAKPVSELADRALVAEFRDPQAPDAPFRGWKPQDPADDAFANLGLTASETDEAKLFSRASPGGKLNLSADELGLFSKSKSSPDEVNAVLRTLLKARYEAYRKDGLKGIAPYTRGKKTISPTDALQQAITQTMTAARQQDYFQALLQYPAKEIPGMEHRFFWFKQTVEDRPTFILAHRTKVRVEEKAALLTEEQFYVSHSYNANFIAGACLAVEGGTMVFYVNRTFTDQVAGFGSGLKHSIGRGQMLSQVEEQLRGVREKLK